MTTALTASRIRTVAEINARIGAGSAIVWTTAELLARTRGGGPGLEVDIVSVAFESNISGTAAMVIVPVAGRGVFTRAESIWLNGVPGVPGPAPNERLGVVDTMIYADQKPERGAPEYTGAELLRDLVSGEEIDVDCVALEGSRHTAKARLRDLEFARFYVYNAFLPADLPAAVVGVMGRGSRVLVNGADAVILGSGTRDGAGARSWSLAADMRDMDAGLMGVGAAPRNMIAIPVPVLDAGVLEGLAGWASHQPASEERERAAGQVRRRIADCRFTLTDTDDAL